MFTEHRDTLNYLQSRVCTLLGRDSAVVVIHGGMGREERMKAQEAFRHDPEVQVLLATDAAGEGINLQRAHLMVNYDLPWNPNRLEQRFGRIHRIGQTEVCHLWNLVAEETREGDVYRKLHPDTTGEAYTWWSNRGQAWANNVGWRIDYHVATVGIASKAQAAGVYKDQRFSDHAPLIVEYDYQF